MTFEIGQQVTYYPVIMGDGSKPENGIETEIISKPWKLGGGEWVVKVKGVSGGVSLRHVFPRIN